ncbi:outer membrane protein [Kordiimonas laminariae]|uniref:outer membrane protein n=1 Tax=Kordiimonas laminariae TaxID=2917717 RepID=UPI001FF28450|nr:outer membrane beta-barrel protein [Kordiimonas laminariae]MCK0070568.1 porin family protein [Kordiimonas laminariae]
MTKLKKVFSGIILLAAASGAASAEDSDKKLFNGLYLGGDVGITDNGDFYYGGSLGYRVQTQSNYVFGIVGTYGTLDISEDYVLTGFPPINVAADDIWSVQGQFGKVFGADKSDLIYIGGGYTKTSATGSFLPPVTLPSISGSSSGYVASLGYEKALSPSLSVKLEANYVNLGERATIDGNSIDTGTKLDAGVFRAGLNFNF